jgi:L-rhamnose-H+ transport protein
MVPPPIPSQPFLGVGMHTAGAFSAATCYAPQKYLRGWSWETYWLAQAAWCWLLLPIIGACFTIPSLIEVLQEAPKDIMLYVFLLGLIYGFGAMAFNVAIRYIGFALTYAIAVGFSSVLGTLGPPLFSGEFTKKFTGSGAGWIFVGMGVGVAGIALCGVAGRFKELDLQAKTGATGDFSLPKGLFLSVFAGVFSALFGCALALAQPICDVAAKHGAGYWQGNVSFLFLNTGAFVTSFFYCLWLGKKNKTLQEYVQPAPGASAGSVLSNHVMALITGTLWYGQFFFYFLGTVRMGRYSYTSWAIQMILMVMFSNLLGVAFREWKGCKAKTWAAIGLALLILCASVVLIAYGNALGNPPAEKTPVPE